MVINGLPSTETRNVFRQIGQFWKERRRPPAVIISLAKGVEAEADPEPHIVTPSLMIHQESECGGGRQGGRKQFTYNAFLFVPKTATIITRCIHNGSICLRL